jgi:uncharacterized repeat protein (TIGR01451 family)
MGTMGRVVVALFVTLSAGAAHAQSFVTSDKTVTDRTAPIGSFRPGDEIDYTIRVRNSGAATATGVVVTDALPAQLTFVSASLGGTFATGTVSWTLGVVPPGVTRTLRVTAQLATPLDNGVIISNTAVIDCLELVPFTTAAAAFTIQSAPVLVVNKVDEHPSLPASPGAAVTYRITLANTGTMVARALRVTDPIDPSLTGASSVTGSACAGWP